MLMANDDEKRSVLWVARVPLPLRLNAETDKSGSAYVLRQYMECTRVLDEVDKMLGCVHLRWRATDK